MAVRRRKTCVATRARTLGREFPNDMRVSMADLHSLTTKKFNPARDAHEAKHHRERAKQARISATLPFHSFKRSVQLKVSVHPILDTPAITLNYPWH